MSPVLSFWKTKSWRRVSSGSDSQSETTNPGRGFFFNSGCGWTSPLASPVSKGLGTRKKRVLDFKCDDEARRALEELKMPRRGFRGSRSPLRERLTSAFRYDSDGEGTTANSIESEESDGDVFVLWTKDYTEEVEADMAPVSPTRIRMAAKVRAAAAFLEADSDDEDLGEERVASFSLSVDADMVPVSPTRIRMAAQVRAAAAFLDHDSDDEGIGSESVAPFPLPEDMEEYFSCSSGSTSDEGLQMQMLRRARLQFLDTDSDASDADDLA